MIAADNYYPFRYASHNDHLPIVQSLYDWSSHEERVAMVAANNYEAFRYASENGHLEIVEALHDWSSQEERAALRFRLMQIENEGMN